MWVYIESKPGLWTVGFFGPNDKWYSESDHSDKSLAIKHVNYLNGDRRNDDGSSRSATKVSPNDAHAKYLTILRHLLAAIEKVEDNLPVMAPAGSRADSTRESLAEASEYLMHNELLLAWDTIYDCVMNTGGEADEIKLDDESGRMFWYDLAQAARLMVSELV